MDELLPLKETDINPKLIKLNTSHNPEARGIVEEAKH